MGFCLVGFSESLCVISHNKIKRLDPSPETAPSPTTHQNSNSVKSEKSSRAFFFFSELRFRPVLPSRQITIVIIVSLTFFSLQQKQQTLLQTTTIFRKIDIDNHSFPSI